MSLEIANTVVVLPFRSGLATVPFKAALPEGRSITLGRLQMRLPDHKSVTLVAPDRHIAFSAIAYKEGREDQETGFADGELRIYAQGKNAASILKRMLPVFRLNAGFDVHAYSAYPWFATQALFDRDVGGVSMRDAATIGGLIQDVALMGRGAACSGVLEFLYHLRGPKTHLQPLGHEVDKLHYLFTEGVDPQYGELAHLVLGFAHAVSTRTVYPGQDKASLEQVYAAATAALGYFDIRTVAHAFVVGALDAAARLDGRKDRRASEYNQRLQEVMNPSLDFSNCAEAFKKLADDMHSALQLTFLGASMLLLAGCEYLESAHGYKYMGLKSQSVKAARSMFRAAHSRMDMVTDEMLKVGTMRCVFIEFVERQFGILGRRV